MNKETIIEEAWNLYCKETAGSFDVRDDWEHLRETVQEYYLHRVVFKTSISYGDWDKHNE